VTPAETRTEPARGLYLDLLKRTLTGAVAEDNDSILGGVRTSGSPVFWKTWADAAGTLAGRFGFEVAYKKPYDPELRAIGRDWPARADSMIGLRRMDNIQQCVEKVLHDDIPGDLIETGVWARWGHDFHAGRPQGLRRPHAHGMGCGLLRGSAAAGCRPVSRDAGDTLFKRGGGLAVGVDQVKHNFERYGLLDEQVQFLVGWFKDTLPAAPIEQLAVMRLDGDLYESTWQAIEALYPRLSPGGFCIVDDYGDLVAPCQRAIHDYRDAHGITEEVIDVDGFGAYWRKAG